MAQQEFIGGRGHDTIRHDKFSNVPNDAFKFAFVRNPWDRYVSAVLAHKDYRDIDKDGFTDFTINNLGQWAFPKNRVSITHFRPQCHFILDNDNNIGVDYVGRFENMFNDWLYICSVVGCIADLPHLNRGNHLPYKEYYTSETWRIVSEAYRLDIQMFDYGNDRPH